MVCACTACAQSFIKTWRPIFWCVADMVLAQLHLQGILTDSHMVMKMMAATGIQQSCPRLCSPAAGVMSTGDTFSQCVLSCTECCRELSQCSQCSESFWSKLICMLTSHTCCTHTQNNMLTAVNGCSSVGNAAACNILS